MFEGLVDANGILLRRDAVANGIDDNALRRLVRAGELTRLRQGIYALTEIWRQSSDVDRHRLLAGGVMRLYDDRVALSHVSACLEQGGPAWGMDLEDVHLTNLYGIGERRAARVAHHRGLCRVDDVSRANGHWITSPTRTALDTASLTTRDPGVCVLDWYLNQGLTTPDALHQAFVSMKEWPDTLGLYRMLDLSRPGSESVGETRTRLLVKDQHLPEPELQWTVRHPSGSIAGRVDMAWPNCRLMLEFDGLVKYGRLRRPGESVADAVIREKRREDLLRELTGWMMIRILWVDLDVPVHTADRIRRAMELAVA